MEDNHKIDFAKKKGKSDEWYTPEDAVLPVLRYLKPGSTVWCPFDKKKSHFVKVLKKEGFKVIKSHIDRGQDFLTYEPDEDYDYIVSNPPYSIRNDILKRVFDIGKPFMLLMNTNGLFDSKVRWDMFNKNNFSLIYLSGRVNYMKEYGTPGESSPPFQSAYVCSGISSDRLLFCERVKNAK